MKREYHEGPKAMEKFKRGMEALFQVPKSAAQNKKQARKPATLRKSKKAGKDKVRLGGRFFLRKYELNAA